MGHCVSQKKPQRIPAVRYASMGEPQMHADEAAQQREDIACDSSTLPLDRGSYAAHILLGEIQPWRIFLRHTPAATTATSLSTRDSLRDGLSRRSRRNPDDPWQVAHGGSPVCLISRRAEGRCEVHPTRDHSSESSSSSSELNSSSSSSSKLSSSSSSSSPDGLSRRPCHTTPGTSV